MSFHDSAILDQNYMVGSSGGPEFLTRIVENEQGTEHRFPRRSQPRRTYSLNFRKSAEVFYDLQEFFIARQGATNGFRVKDPSDFSTGTSGRGTPSSTDVVIGTGDGTTTTFQLKKLYTDGGVSHTRTLSKPIAGTVVVALDGVAQASGWSVDNATGVITFTSAPAGGVSVTAGCEFHTPVRFTEGSGEAFQVGYDNYHTFSGGVFLIEVLDAAASVGDGHFGGSNEEVMSSNMSLSLPKGRLNVLEASTTGLKALLPGKATVPPGGPVFVVVNAGSNSFAVRDSDTNADLVTVDAGETVEVYLAVTTGSTRAWYAT